MIRMSSEWSVVSYHLLCASLCHSVSVVHCFTASDFACNGEHEPTVLYRSCYCDLVPAHADT
jgi:hypothetical protein